MPRIPRPVLAFAVSTAVVLATVSACTDAQTPTTRASPPAASSAVPTAIASDPSAPGSPSSAPASTHAQNPDAVTISIVIDDGNVSPNGDKLNIRQGDTVLLKVTSDSDDEIHAHTGGDGYQLQVKAGIPATGEFVAADTGSFEVESHHLEKIIVILNVR